MFYSSHLQKIEVSYKKAIKQFSHHKLANMNIFSKELFKFHIKFYFKLQIITKITKKFNFIKF